MQSGNRPRLASPALSTGLNFQGRASFAELLTRRPHGSTPPSASRSFSSLSCETMSDTSAAMWEVAQMWGAHSQMRDEDPTDDELQPTKFPKRAGKGAGKLEKRPREPQTAPPRGPKQTHLLTLARMMARHEMALQQLEADRSWVIFWKLGNHQPADADNSHVEETEIEKRVLLQPPTSPYGGHAHGARSEDGQAGDRHIGPDPASEGEDPLAGPLAVAIHEVESGEKAPRANGWGAALSHDGPDSTSRTEVPHSAGGHDPRIPCNGRYERREGGSHALQADPVDGGTSQGNHPRDPHPVHGILDAQADWCPATPGKEPSTAAKGTAATSPARAVQPTTKEPSSAPVVHGETRNSLTPGVPKSAPTLTQQGGKTATAHTPNLARGKPSVAPKDRDKTLTPQAKGRPKSVPETPGGCTAARVQTIFSRGSTKTLETLPTEVTEVLSEDLQRNDRHKRAKEKLHSGLQSNGNNLTVGKLSKSPKTGKEEGNLSAWLLRGAARKLATAEKSSQSARSTFSLILLHLFKPSLLILATIVTLTHWFRRFSGSIRHDPQHTAQSLVTCMQCCDHYPLQVQQCSFIEGKLDQITGDMAKSTTTARCSRIACAP